MFNQLDLKLLNESTLDIYLDISDERKSETTYNASKLNFTWEPTEFLADQLRIKLLFENPLYISPNIEQDLLVIKFLNLELFYSADDGKALHPNWRIISSPIKKQM